MQQTSTAQRPDLRRIALAAGASVVTSAAWYAAWGSRLAELDDAYAGDARPPAWVLPVELARSATVATAVAMLAGRGGDAGTGSRLRLGAGLWAAFPVVLLTGSVVHEKVPWQQAAIHGGDWLVKLLLVAGVVGGGRRS
ncbi:MAG TPA: DUF1761 domain-containing protein [Blastococcus sp.]|nr:DUF1761 domain-containing protein [Blastococcus sp.]